MYFNIKHVHVEDIGSFRNAQIRGNSGTGLMGSYAEVLARLREVGILILQAKRLGTMSRAGHLGRG